MDRACRGMKSDLRLSISSAAYIIRLRIINVQLPPRCGSPLERTSTPHTMSLLRPSLTGRLLRAAGPITGRATPAFVRYDSQTSSGTPLIQSDDKSQPLHRSGWSTMANHPQAKDTQVSHNNPDWDAEVDRATSYAHWLRTLPDTRTDLP
jgi:hypothetical protein